MGLLTGDKSERQAELGREIHAVSSASKPYAAFLARGTCARPCIERDFVCVCVCACVCARACAHLDNFTYVLMRQVAPWALSDDTLCVCVCMYVCMYVCMCVCVCACVCHRCGAAVP
jgi:hypothetical protein